MEIQAWLAQQIRSLTINQWQEIDRQFSDRGRWDGRAVTALLVAAVVLLIGQFFCRADFLTRFGEAREFFSSLPYPRLYPLLYWALATTLNYFLLPVLVIKFIYREKLKNFGFVLPPGAKWLLLYSASPSLRPSAPFWEGLSWEPWP